MYIFCKPDTLFRKDCALITNRFGLNIVPEETAAYGTKSRGMLLINTIVQCPSLGLN